MKHAKILLSILQLFMLYPFFILDWHWAICFIPTMIVAFWYLMYGLFIVLCELLIWLCKVYCNLKDK